MATENNFCEEVWNINPGSNNASTTDKSHRSEEEAKKNEDIKENKDENKPFQIILKCQGQPKIEEQKKSEIDDYFPEKKDSDLDDVRMNPLEMQQLEKDMNKDNQIPNKEKEEDEKEKKEKEEEKKEKKDKKVEKKKNKKDMKKKLEKKDEISKVKIIIIKKNIKNSVCPNKNKILGIKTKSSRKRLKKKILLIRSKSNGHLSEEPKEFNNIAEFRLLGSNTHNNIANTDNNINASSLTNLNINRSHGDFAVYNNVSNHDSINIMNNHYQNNENEMTNFKTKIK